MTSGPRPSATRPGILLFGRGRCSNARDATTIGSLLRMGVSTWPKGALWRGHPRGPALRASLSFHISRKSSGRRAGAGRSCQCRESSCCTRASRTKAMFLSHRHASGPCSSNIQMAHRFLFVQDPYRNPQSGLPHMRPAVGAKWKHVKPSCVHSPDIALPLGF